LIESGERIPIVILQATNIALTIRIEMRGMFTGLGVQIGTVVLPGKWTWDRVLELKRKMRRQSTWKIILLEPVLRLGLRLGTLTRIAAESKHVGCNSERKNEKSLDRS
jgi:hypothetical protein